MIILSSICLMLAVMSYFCLTKDTFLREYQFMVHDFRTPFYHIGITCEDTGCEDQRVSCLSIGLLFFVLRITTYANTKETIEQYPWLYEKKLLPKWQQALMWFDQLLKSPGKNLDKLL